MSKIKELKEHLKYYASMIKEKKLKHKEWQKDKTKECVDYPFLLRHDFRHCHIAYCVLRGTERDMIEKPAKDHKPNEDYIKEIINAYTEPVKEDVCVSSQGS